MNAAKKACAMKSGHILWFKQNIKEQEDAVALYDLRMYPSRQTASKNMPYLRDAFENL